MEKFNISDLQEFSSDKRVRKHLAKDKRIEVDLLFYQPGQSSPEHKHVNQDEVFYVVTGEATMAINGKPVPIRAKDLILVPSGTTHGLANSGSENLTMLFVKNAAKPVE